MTTELSLHQPTLLVPSSAGLESALEALKKILTTLFDSSFISRPSTSTTGESFNSARLKKNFNFKKNKFFFIPLAIIVVVLFFGIVSLVRGKPTTPASVMSATTDQRVELKQAIKSKDINKTFSFPLKNAAGKEVSKIKYTIEKVELRDEIIVKGQKATSVKGRSFLIIPVKIQNDFNAPVEISARDYIRLIIENSNEKLAPDIHNDPVEVQAISTKQTRVGFPIDDTVRKVVLQVGEIKGDKENITIDLK